MAWASKKQYAILMGSEEGKKLADKLNNMEQDEFNKAFSDLIGKKSTKEEPKKEEEKKDTGKYQKSFKERTEEEKTEDFETLTSDEYIGTTFGEFKKPDGVQIKVKANEEYQKILKNINDFASQGNLEEKTNFINDLMMKAYNDGLISKEEYGQLVNRFDEALKEAEKKKEEEEKNKDYSNFYEGKGKEKLNDILSKKFKNRSGKITPNGKKLLEQLVEADDELSGVIGTFYNQNPNIEIKLGKNYNSYFRRQGYWTVRRSVSLGGESMGNDNNYSKGGVFFHESGHALDYSFSSSYVETYSYDYISKKHNKSLSDMIKEEIKQNVDLEQVKKDFQEIKDSYQNDEYRSLLNQRDALDEELGEISNNVFKNPQLKDLEQEMSTLRKQKVDAFRVGKYEEMKNYQRQAMEKQEKYEELSRSLYPKDYQEKREKLREFDNKISNMREEAYNRANVTYGGFSDMLQASLGSRLSTGHSRNYFNKDKRNRGTEAFAEIMSAKSTNPKTLEIMQKYIPKTLEIFDEIITNIKKGSKE